MFYGDMRQRDRGRASKKLPPFVPILKEMIKSPAFEQLTNASRTAYLLLKAQCKHYDDLEVKFPYSHAVPFMDRNTFSRSIQQLEELGFIERSFMGGLYRRTTIYKLIDSWKDINAKSKPLANSIRGMETHTTDRVQKQANRYGNPYH